MTIAAQRRTLIGWQGISLWVPDQWMLVAVGGDRRAGSLRVDDEDMARLQVKWARGPIDLERKRAEYIKRLTVGRRRRPTGIEVETGIHVLSSRAKPKKQIATFAWRGRHCGMGVLWNCEVCGRALIAQVSWGADEDGWETAQEVLQSLDDHGVEEWDTWGVDGLAFLAPTAFALESWKRMTRYLDLRLSRGAEQLRVARWGMVPLVLGNKTVSEWYDLQSVRRRDVTYRAGETTIKGHQGVAAQGTRRGVRAAMGRWGEGLLRRPSGGSFGARAWHCPDSNRLYLVESIGGDGELLEGVTASVICHEEG